jgi:hypothetical protein
MVQLWRWNKSAPCISSPQNHHPPIDPDQSKKIAGLLSGTAGNGAWPMTLAFGSSPVGAGVTVGESRHDHDRDRVREKTSSGRASQATERP